MSDATALKAFVAVAREGSLSRAAQQLHLTQPAVSLQLKGLQERLGVRLFERTARGMRLTPDGAALLPLADRALAAQREFWAAAQRLRQQVRGTLSIGTILDPEFTRLGAFLHELVETAPHLQTVLRQGMSGEVLQRLDAGAHDVGYYLGNPNVDRGVTDRYRVRRLTTFTYRVLAPTGWEPQVRGADWAALAALPWIETPPESAHHRLLQRTLAPLGVRVRRVALVDQEASMLDLVRSGVGLSLVRDAVAIREAQARGLVVADRVWLSCELTFIALRERAAEPPIATAWAALEPVWGGGSDVS
ncbi:LysR family transcriptional regulator [Tepidimonas charontis]|uniref:HTH-type transcriptional regulator YofA n=1 Tax=Tepidimonas charontis TaxID=2267262 RepID=A0A554XHI4_9BURK|nr:LysR family transcriptional regulator [Tepidimonas charontis]TSE35291.1 HTH-type transcriptional regulator YofA [Tepidimonas charontis]